MIVDPSIFKAYDIRGIVGESLNLDTVTQIGRAIGTLVKRGNKNAVCVGRDGRLSGPSIITALVKGITDAGTDVINIGQVTSPMLYYATHELQTGNGVMVTGSHNPPEYNGLKIVLNGDALFGDQIQEILKIIQTEGYVSGHGQERQDSVNTRYFDRVVSGIKLKRPMKISIDCGNGVAGANAAEIYRSLGCKVRELYCEVDGNFPNHHPDPSKPENLTDLINDVTSSESEIGLAFDGDGDRLGVVTAQGKIIYPDRLMMLFAQDVLSREPGAEIIYDVKCTRNLNDWIKANGGKPKMWKTGHSLIKAEMKRSGSPFGGEMSGHFFFKERWYGFDDGTYSGARLLEFLTTQRSIDDTFSNLPDPSSTPELQIQCREGENFEIIEKLKQQGEFPGATDKITIDGIRVEYSDGFGLARPSNTTPTIVLRFEADNEESLSRIVNSFRNELEKISKNLILPTS